MTLTTLEKATFVALFVGILFGLGLIAIQLRAHADRNQAVLREIAVTQALTPKTPLTKGSRVTEDDRDAHTKLNINHATLKDLEMLPGIGRVTAQRILEYRAKQGEIRDLNELASVRGITRRKHTFLRRFLTTTGGRKGGLGEGKRLNLNFATAEELEQLPGIGRVTARAIIEIRTQRGGAFHKIEDLLDVPGLTEARLERFVDLVEVR